MKRLALLTVLCFITCMMYGQIQDTFFDMTIGKTTLTEALPILEKHGFEVSQFSENEFHNTSVEYDGIDWDRVQLTFWYADDDSDDMVLDKVEFNRFEFIPVDDSNEDIEYLDKEQAEAQIAEIQKIGAALEKNLTDKYSQYIVSEEESCKVFNDNSTDLFFYVGTTAGGYGYMVYAAQAHYGRVYDND